MRLSCDTWFAVLMLALGMALGVFLWVWVPIMWSTVRTLTRRGR